MNAPAAVAPSRAADLAEPDDARASTPSSRARPGSAFFHRPQWSRGGRARLRPDGPLSGRGAGRRCSRRAAAHRNPLASVRQCPGLGRLRHRRRHPRRGRQGGRGLGRCRLGARRTARLRSASSCAAGRLPEGWQPAHGGLCPLRPRALRDLRGIARLDPAQAARRGAPRSGFGLESHERHRRTPSRRPLSRLCGERPQSRHAGLPARALRSDARRFWRRGRDRPDLEGRPSRWRPCSASPSTAAAIPIGAAAPARRGSGGPTTSSISR